MRNRSFKSWRYSLVILGGVELFSLATFASPPQQLQEPPSPATPPTASVPAPPEKESATPDVQPPFTVRIERDMVIVRVIVRDANGRPVRALRKEDFCLFDNGKAQAIDQFSIESPGVAPVTAPAAPGKPSQEKPAPEPAPASATVAPQNFQALYFDDIQSDFSDLNRARSAAEKYVAATRTPADRVGIFTVSGQGVLDFTADRERLHEALSSLRPRPLFVYSSVCSDISPFEAMLILSNPLALEALENQAKECGGGSRQKMDAALALAALERLSNDGRLTSEAVQRGIERVVLRIAQLPGQRSVVMLSPGLLDYSFGTRIYEIAERALRAGVVINALNLGGLYAIIPGGDASEGVAPAGPPTKFTSPGLEGMAEVGAYSRVEDVLYDFAAVTGGQVFHNDNDLEKGLRRVGTLAYVYYLLAFSPGNLKLDGRYHQLKVSLVHPARLTVQARHGYFAPRGRDNPEERAKSQIREAVYGSYPIQDLALTFETEVRKTEEQNEDIAVQAVLDISNLLFQKQGDRNVDNVVFAVGLFDNDGKYVTGSQQTYRLTLKDSTRTEMEKGGLSLKTHVSARVGAYTLRVVVLDSQSGMMAASSKTVEAPL